MREAFLELCEQQHARVVRFLLVCGAPLLDAQDATQEAFLAAWTELNTRPEKWQEVRNPAGWLRKVAINCWRRPPGSRNQVALRSRSSSIRLLWEKAQPGADPGELTPVTLTVLDTLARLGGQAPIVWAFHRDGFTNVEIGELLGCPAQQITDQLKKVRKALRAALADVTEGRTPR
ncbi:MAG: sigma-70 family RNA polymerase sigma factor [Catenulispora sp.]|nr:sigma-70 family RNA polymerase sigma factor [Catenulispora sp.]